MPDLSEYSTAWWLGPAARGLAYALLGVILHMLGGWSLVMMGGLLVMFGVAVRG